MIHSIRGTRGAAVAPRALAAQSALDALREGGNARKAKIAAAVDWREPLAKDQLAR